MLKWETVEDLAAAGYMPVSPVDIPSEWSVRVLGGRPYRAGDLFDRIDVLFVDLRLESPDRDEARVKSGVEFQHRSSLGLSSLEEVSTRLRHVIDGEAGAPVARLADYRRRINDEADEFGPGVPPAFEGATEQRAFDLLADADDLLEALGDTQPEMANRVREMLSRSYALGHEIALGQLKGRYEEKIAKVGPRNRAAAQKGAELRSEKARAWREKTRQWVQSHVDDVGRHVPNSRLAKWVLDNWDGRGFVECAGNGGAPEHSTILSLLREWKITPSG